jgi:predicted component of type VI protein secretion system
MKINLVVLTPGKTEGKLIPITLPQFVIGRDPKCHLRPASPIISQKHCALLTRGDKVFVHDFNSTNGTFVNERQIKGQIELQDKDKLRLGPLIFGVQIGADKAAPSNEPAPPPPAKAPAGGGEDETAAALLLSLEDTAVSAPGSAAVDSEGVPTGSTVMEIPVMPPPPEPEGPAAKPPPGKTPAAKPTPSGDTSSSARAILEKYLRRPRT